jgi:hypothetical protein
VLHFSFYPKRLPEQNFVVVILYPIGPLFDNLYGSLCKIVLGYMFMRKGYFSLLIKG